MNPLVTGLLALSVSLSASAIDVSWSDPIPDPPTNPTADPIVRLGQALYFDTRLSSDGSIACASCHIPAQGGDDDLPVSPGVGGQLGVRNAQTVFNTGLMSAQFWDGRAPSLEEQSKQPLVNPVEMGNSGHAAVVTKIKNISGYPGLFTAAFGSGDVITIDNFAAAVAAFERTLLTPDSAFDKYQKDIVPNMTPQQIDGMNLFGSIGCTQCHRGVLLARQGSPGTPFTQPFPRFPANAAFQSFNATYDLTSDLGRGAVTGNAADNNRWKVPTLRNVAITAPYFHNGSVATLDEAVRIMAAGQLNMTLSQAQVDDLVAFLAAQTGVLPDPQPIVVGGTTRVPIMPALFAVLLAIGMVLVRRRV